MKSCYARAIAAMVSAGFLYSSSALAAPAITGQPTFDGPPVLEWARDVSGTPDLTEPTSNLLADLHGHIGHCDLVLSTAGNYHMALKELWPLYLARFGQSLDTWLYTTSPPVVVDQLANNRVIVGNTELGCRPQVAVAPKRMMDRLKATGYLDGEPQLLFQSRGNVILVKRGNPKRIRSVWDLGRQGVRVSTPNPEHERGSFEGYANSIYEIANYDVSHRGMTADQLFNAVFNSGRQDKWFSGRSIHHREVPWSVAYGQADAGVMFYHLAANAVQQFPTLFEMVPLGGSIADPKPVAGNSVSDHYIARIKGDWNKKQLEARNHLVETMLSEDFAAILTKHGMTATAPSQRNPVALDGPR